MYNDKSKNGLINLELSSQALSGADGRGKEVKAVDEKKKQLEREVFHLRAENNNLSHARNNAEARLNVEAQRANIAMAKSLELERLLNQSDLSIKYYLPLPNTKNFFSAIIFIIFSLLQINLFLFDPLIASTRLPKLMVFLSWLIFNYSWTRPPGRIVLKGLLNISLTRYTPSILWTLATLFLISAFIMLPQKPPLFGCLLRYVLLMAIITAIYAEEW